jgi:hypothetical protein
MVGGTVGAGPATSGARAVQLFEEQRVAFGPLDALRHEGARGIDQPAGQQLRLVRTQRRQIDARQITAMDRCPPRLVDRVAFDARAEQ